MIFGWKVVTGYFLGYLLVYLITHWSWDAIMLLKNSGKAHYPYPKSQNIPAIIGYCLSTIFFWLSIIIFPIRSLITKTDVCNSNIVPALLQPIVRMFGMIIMSMGLFIGILGRWARGNYLSHNTPQLQTRMGFAFVRHPNYFQYLCGFIGVPLISLHLFTLVLPLLGFYGYIVIAREEEERLLLEFGDRYQDYQEKVGMLFPKVSIRHVNKRKYLQISRFKLYSKKMIKSLR